MEESSMQTNYIRKKYKEINAALLIKLRAWLYGIETWDMTFFIFWLNKYLQLIHTVIVDDSRMRTRQLYGYASW